MARYVHPDVEAYAQSASGDVCVRLALVVADGDGDAVRERIEELDGDVDRELPSGVLLVELAAARLPALFEVEGIDSISLASGMELLA